MSHIPMAQANALVFDLRNPGDTDLSLETHTDATHNLQFEIDLIANSLCLHTSGSKSPFRSRDRARSRPADSMDISRIAGVLCSVLAEPRRGVSKLNASGCAGERRPV